MSSSLFWRRGAFIGTARRPQANQYVLGITSLWMLIPGVYGIQLHDNLIELVLSLLSILVTIVSLVHWKHCIQHSALHHLDRALATFCFFLLCAMSTSFQNVLFASAVLVSYVLAQYCILMSWINMNLISHLIFRFVGYWWTCSHCIGNIHLNSELFYLHSLVYWVHAAATYLMVQAEPRFRCADHYITGCVQLLVLLALLPVYY